MRIAIPFFIVIFIAFACKVVKTETDQKEDVQFQTIKSGVLMGGGEEGITQGIIPVRNSDDWNRFLEKANKINYHIDSTLFDEVDQESEMLLAVFEEVKGSGGYTFEIESIQSINGENNVYVRTTAPSGSAISVLTQPYVLIKLKKRTGRFALILQ